MLPIGRWKGYGGETDHQGSAFETITWATGLLAVTERMTVFGTVHTPLFHPVIAAKQMVTADHVGSGRFGLNIVCGWNEGEFAMFGVDQREHDDRYEHGQEWLDLVRAIWERDDFDFDGKYFTAKGMRAKPKPWGGTQPFLMNAGSSPQGEAFALRNCDAIFSRMPFQTDPGRVMTQIAAFKARALESGNTIEVFTSGSVTCRPTKREAEEYYHFALEENVDWDAIDYMIELRRKNATADERAQLRVQYRNGLAGFIFKGSPDDVAADFAHASAAGLAGLAFSFINFLDEFPYFRDEVLPRLERLGLRAG